jgi:hypothetical protein
MGTEGGEPRETPLTFPFVFLFLFRIRPFGEVGACRKVGPGLTIH